jgi:hypothetical protein
MTAKIKETGRIDAGVKTTMTPALKVMPKHRVNRRTYTFCSFHQRISKYYEILPRLNTTFINLLITLPILDRITILS